MTENSFDISIYTTLVLQVFDTVACIFSSSGKFFFIDILILKEAQHEAGKRVVLVTTKQCSSWALQTFHAWAAERNNHGPSGILTRWGCMQVVVSSGGAPTQAGTSVFTKHNWDIWKWGICGLMGGAFIT